MNKTVICVCVIIGILLIAFSFKAEAQSRKTLEVKVSRLAGSGADSEDIQAVPDALTLNDGDKITFKIEEDVWCPGSAVPLSGNVKISVGANDCNFVNKVYTINEPTPRVEIDQLLEGAANSTPCQFEITVTYNDDDCSAGLQGRDVATVRVYCNRDVPTLSEWGLIIFSLLILTLITIVMVRQKRSKVAASH